MSEVDDILAEIESEEDEDSPHAEVIEAAESEADHDDDKMERKLKRRYEELEKKLDQSEVKRIIKDFELDADDIEKDLFGDLKAEIHNPRDAELAAEKARKYAKALRERTAKVEAEAEAEVKEKAAKAWGFQAPGRAQPERTDEEKALMERISNGDMAALVEAVVGDDTPF